jgi:hypothetical protein
MKKITIKKFYDIVRKEFIGNSLYKYITIDNDGTVCAWGAGEPVYDRDIESWDNGTFNFNVLGKLIDAPEYMDFSEELYTREMFVKEQTQQETADEFSAAALHKIADGVVKNRIVDMLRESATNAAKIGDFSASIWIGWISPSVKESYVAEATKLLEQKSFAVWRDKGADTLGINW